jgi:polyisoprenoid-binding protein YceI
MFNMLGPSPAPGTISVRKEHAMSIFGRKNDDTATGAPAAVNPDLASLTGDYTIDPAHSTLGFVARHAMVTNVKGKFNDFTGTLHLDGTDPTRSTATVDAKMDSIDTGSPDRDGHLKSSDFFRTEEFPTMTFRSTRAEALGGDDYRITGDLTLLGVTKPLTIDLEFNGAAKDPFGNERVGFEGKAEILRSEWGLTWNAALETGGVLVSDKIKLNFDISAIKTA